MSSIACFARRLGCALVLAALPLSSTSSLAAPPSNKPGTTPQKKIWPCLGQTTRPADKLVQMQAGKSFYKETVSTTPVTTPPQFESGALSVAQAKAASCTRRVIELRVPASTSSGCSDCYPNAEISVGAGTFANSKEFEEYFHVPKSSVSKADCETFKHQIEVFRKPSGATEFEKTPIRTWVYRGFVDSSGCRVAAKNQGQIWDTAEVFANVTPPASGTDVYRVTSLPKFKGAVLDTVIVVEFEKQQ